MTQTFTASEYLRSVIAEHNQKQTLALESIRETAIEFLAKLREQDTHTYSPETTPVENVSETRYLANESEIPNTFLPLFLL
jgi:hypothetical protein